MTADTGSGLPWWRSKLIGLDLETTGVNPHEDRIVTASIVYVAGVLRPKTTTWVIDPGVPVPDEAAAIHGWTAERLHDDPRTQIPYVALYDLLGQLGYKLHRTGAPLVVFNAAYDLTILDAECARHDVDPLASRLEHGLRPVIDPLVLDKHADPYRKGKRNLAAQCAHHRVPLGDAHDSAADAVAACRLAQRVIESSHDLQRMTPDQLHDAQAGWRAEQQQSLAAYFDKRGTPHDGCPGGWPTVPTPSAIAS